MFSFLVFSVNQHSGSLESKQKGIEHTRPSSRAQGLHILVCIQVSSQPISSLAGQERAGVLVAAEAYSLACTPTQSSDLGLPSKCGPQANILAMVGQDSGQYAQCDFATCSHWRKVFAHWYKES